VIAWPDPINPTSPVILQEDPDNICASSFLL
jgi:hypothetical protein